MKQLFLALVATSIALTGASYSLAASSNLRSQAEEAMGIGSDDSNTNVKQQMQDKAQTLIDKISPSLRENVLHPFGSDDRTSWTYLPWGHTGVPLRKMPDESQQATVSLAHSLLSDRGRDKLEGVLLLEAELERGTWFKWFRNPANYYLSLFGSPGDETWSWRFGGHHLSLNATVTSQGISDTPLFIGANPANVLDGPNKGFRLLGWEEDTARSLFLSLNSKRQDKALLSAKAPKDIVTERDAQVGLRCCEGLTVSAMDTAQRVQLITLMRKLLGTLREELAQQHWQRIEMHGLDRLFFAWAGSAERGEGHYFRIHGPSILIEYDNTQNNANHAHLVIRDPQNDFAHDALLEHHKAQAH